MKRYETGLALVLFFSLVSISLGGAYLWNVGYVDPVYVLEVDREIHVTRDLRSNINLYLNVKHYRGGELVGDFWKENDLILSNYVNWTALTLSGRFDVFNLTDDQGQNGALSSGEEPPEEKSYIAIGTGTNTPGFTNYTLQTETHREAIDDWLLEVSGTSYNMTATSFYTFSGGYAITEAGFCAYYDDLADEVFFTRDTFTAQNVVADDTLAVSIIFEFTGGITDNYGELLANAHHGDSAQGDNEPEEEGGGSESLHESNGLWYTSGAEDWTMVIGTSNAAFDVTDYDLGNEVYSDQIDADEQVIWDNSGSDCNITVIGYFSIDASYSIYEIGLFTPIREDGGGNPRQVLLLREVRGSGYAVESGDNIAVYVTWVIDQP